MTSKYGEGTWFAVPLNDGRYALGLVARIVGGGRLGCQILGYFFGPAHSKLPDFGTSSNLEPTQAMYVTQFSDLGLHEGKWPVVGYDPRFERNKWPIPELFAMEDLLGGQPWGIRINEELEETNRFRITEEEADGLPQAGLAGSRYVEIVLSRLLNAEPE